MMFSTDRGNTVAPIKDILQYRMEVSEVVQDEVPFSLISSIQNLFFLYGDGLLHFS